MIRSFLCCFSILFTLGLSAQEICNNGIDDDADGLIDLNDTTDCACGQVSTGPNESLIPNPSFEDQDCIPDSWSELSCANGWEQATTATSDYFATNGFMPSMFPMPVNGGHGFAGAYAFPSWQEYLGACLNSPMLTGQEYSITFNLALFSPDGVFGSNGPTTYSPIDVTIFGLSSCPSFPVNTVDCPQGLGWIELGHANYVPSQTWSELTISFTPTVDVRAVILGSPCTLPPDWVMDISGHAPYFIFDNLTLGERVETHVVMEDAGSFCTDDRTLVAHPDTVIGDWQWYRDGIALVGQTDTILHLSTLSLDTGLYQFQINVGDTVCSLFPWPVGPDVPPHLHLSAAPHNGCAPLLVNFTNTTDPDSMATIAWDFGDTGTSSAVAPSHTYTDAGTYDVTVNVTPPNGCVTDTTFTDWITVYPMPVASFTSDVQEICAGQSVTFTNNTGILTNSCSWTFGDGGSSTDCNPTYTYNTPGLQSVRLTVTTANTCADDSVRVQFINVHDKPDVSFTAEPTEGCVPWTVQFTNTTPAAQVDSVYWDFGQGEHSNDAAPHSTYTDPGVYDVRLSVTDDVGCTADTTITALVTTHGHPIPSFTFSPDSGCYPLDVSFVNTTDPSFNSTCTWDFGDGGSSTICDTMHTYLTPGVYTVSLTTISEFGCDGDTTMADIITVFDHPTAGFTFGPQPTDVFQTQQVFVNTSSSDAITWSWAFDRADPDSSSIPDPVVLFPGGDPGEYPVQLIVSNIHTCTDTAAATVIIGGYFSVYAPNAFTPDGDGVNEGWRPIWKDLDEASYKLSIYDRWGREVWATADAFLSWDGKVSGAAPKPDVYVWRLEARDTISQKGHQYLGHVTVLR